MAHRFLLEQEECLGKMEKKSFRTGCLEGDFGDPETCSGHIKLEGN